MSTIVSIATGVPANKYKQEELCDFAAAVHCRNEEEKRKLKFLYKHSNIEHRYSVIPDFNRNFSDYEFFPQREDLEPFPTIDIRMEWFGRHAATLSADTILKCIDNKCSTTDVTHLITVSCTGMSAPGLDLQLVEQLKLKKNVVRTSVNFMGCYAAIHALKLADAFCKTDNYAKVLIVCTELCTLHFQKTPTPDNITSTLLFGDGCAAVLVDNSNKGIKLKGFHSTLFEEGKDEMAWNISSNGFQMTLTGEIPGLIRENFSLVAEEALSRCNYTLNDVTHWCMHPGGKKILDSIAESVGMDRCELQLSYEVLRKYGNMSSATILFVLKEILEQKTAPVIFGAAFGPGLTVETFTATHD